MANILTLPENDEVLVVGTVYKDMKLKPSILDEYVKVCLLRYQLNTVLKTCCDRLHALQVYVHLMQHRIALLLGDSGMGLFYVSMVIIAGRVHTCGLQDRGASQLVGRTKFVGADDSIILEDESARMKLRGDGLPVGQLVTGVVMAVKGVAAPGGDFQVNVSCSVYCPEFVCLSVCV